MKISVKDLHAFKNLELGSKGITFDVHDNKKSHLGDLRIGKKTVEWCKGRKHSGNGVKKNWDELIAFFERETS